MGPYGLDGEQDERASLASRGATAPESDQPVDDFADQGAGAGIAAGDRTRVGPLIALGVLVAVAIGAFEFVTQAAAPVAAGGKTSAVDLLAGNVGELRADMDRTALRLALIEARAAGSAESEHGNGEIRALAAAVALMGLQQRTRADTPFAADLALVRPLLRDLAGSETPLTTLVAHAAGGVPSSQDLAIEFGRLRPLLRAQAEAQAAAGEGGLWHGVLAALHLAEPAPLDPSLALAAQAETELARGRLAGAVAALDQLSPGGRVIVSGWLAAARVRLAVDDSVDSLLDRALAGLARGN
jgi:hypothetical protein